MVNIFNLTYPSEANTEHSVQMTAFVFGLVPYKPRFVRKRRRFPQVTVE